MQPLCAPVLRSTRVRRRVSIPAMATVPSSLQVLRQGARGAEVGNAQRNVLDDQAGGMDLGGLDILVIDAHVADVRIRQRDDLPAIAGVGEDFLVAGERGVEHHLAHRVAGRTNAGAEEGRAVCECEQCGGQDGQQVKSSEVRAPIAIRFQGWVREETVDGVS
jgi:hypothetical protein